MHLQASMNRLGAGLQATCVETIFAAVDANHDGNVAFAELLAVMESSRLDDLAGMRSQRAAARAAGETSDLSTGLSLGGGMEEEEDRALRLDKMAKARARRQRSKMQEMAKPTRQRAKFGVNADGSDVLFDIKLGF